jgi:tRNA-2-methylthio-N6-dimethylallyladenosine synthase
MTELFVDPAEIADRFERLKVVIERSALAHNQARLGWVEEAIVEGPSKKDPEALSGRTRQGKLVHFAPPDEQVLAPGSFVSVRVERAAPHHLVGKLVSLEQTPTRRVRERIPVSSG